MLERSHYLIASETGQTRDWQVLCLIIIVPEIQVYSCRCVYITLSLRFTEFFVDEFQSSSDLQLIVLSYLKDLSPTPPLVDGSIK